MIEYLLILIATILCAFFNKRMATDLRIFSLAFLCFCLILLFGLRFHVGIDTMNYNDSYASTPTLDEYRKIDWENNLREPGYLLLSIICRSITKEFWLIQVVIAAITNITIFIFLYKTCKNSFVGILLYYFMACLYFSTEIMREACAVGIFLLNYIYNFRKNRISRYFLFCFLSLFFHYSALITFLFPFTKNIKPNLIYWILIALIALSTPLLVQFNELLAIASIQSRMDIYVYQAELLNLNFRISLLLHSVVPATILYYFAFIKHYDLPYKNMILVHIFLCAGILGIPVIFQRLTNYTEMFIVCSLANVILSKGLRTILKIFVIVLTMLSYGFYYYQRIYQWYPYVSIFNPYDTQERLQIRWEVFNK